MKLTVSYYEDTDTLSFWNGVPAKSADDVADNLFVDYNADGEAVGIALEHAAEILLPILQAAMKASEESKGSSVRRAKAP